MMRLKQFAGLGGPRVTVAGGNVANGPSGTRVELEFRADGTVWRVADGFGDAQLGSWITPNSAASTQDYEIRFTRNSGTVEEVGITGSFLALSANRGVGYSAPSTGESGEFTVEIRLGTAVLDSGIYTITN